MYVMNNSFYDCSSLSKVTVGKNINCLGVYKRGYTSLNGYYGDAWYFLRDAMTGSQVIEIDSDNRLFFKREEIIYETLKGGTRVLLAPKDAQTVNLMENVISIEFAAFANCKKLKSIVLPAGLIELKNSAFIYCNVLSEVYFLGEPPAYWNSGAFEGTPSSLILYYLSTASGWTTPKWYAPDGYVFNAKPFTHTEHEYSSDWVYDENNHWLACVCGLIKNKNAHYDNNADDLCDVCGYKLPHTHKYGDWKSDEKNHWKECSCGAKSGLAVHEDKNSDEICDICGYKLPHVHKYSDDWKSDEKNHWKECSCGAKSGLAVHADENADESCDICSYKLPHVHKYSDDWKSDEKNHWKECSCGVKSELAVHEDKNSDESCDICSCKVAHVHKYGDWKSDEKNHWKECSCGVKTNPAAHVDSDGDELCDVCTYDMSHVHKYGDWVYDDENHWKECSCGAKTNPAAHVDSDGDELCDTCDYLMTHDHKYGNWKFDEKIHWKVCSCGAKTDPVPHMDSDEDASCDVCGYKPMSTPILLTLKGRVTSSGNPNDSILIELIPVGETQPVASTTIAGDATEYVLENIQPGSYILRIQKKNHIPREYQLNIK